jgi:RimJ/RimL family protein N-acetyltransferase
MSELHTARFRLRLAAKADAPFFFELDADPAVMKYINGGTPSTLEETKAAAGRVEEVAQRTQGRFGVWLAFAKNDGAFAGWVLLRPDKANPDDWGVVELGYRLKQAWWRQGVATELSQRMLAYAFNEQGAREVYAIAMKDNLGSQAVMRKVGLVYSHDYDDTQFPGPAQRAVRYRLTADAYDT